jgi:hypothetical protein
MELSRTVELRSCEQRTHCNCDAPVDEFLTKDLAGQYDAINISSDSRPSQRIIVAVQVENGGPLSPARRGPHTNAMAELETFDADAKRLIVLEDEDDLSRQLLFRKAGNREPENAARCASDGNKPVNVIDA